MAGQALEKGDVPSGLVSPRLFARSQENASIQTSVAFATHCMKRKGGGHLDQCLALMKATSSQQPNAHCRKHGVTTTRQGGCSGAAHAIRITTARRGGCGCASHNGPKGDPK
eukprot:5716953-Amphidinium_carterae.2